MGDSKYCIRCGKIKPLTEFLVHKSGRYMGNALCYCHQCNTEKNKTWRDVHPCNTTKWNHKRGYKTPMREAKECSLYLGVVVAETVLSKEFDSVIRMPHGNKGFDFYCKNGYKIDSKASCLRDPNRYAGDNLFWNFHIRRNDVADFFICVGYDNRDKLNPMHVWLIPGKLLSHLISLTILNTRDGLAKWSKYERPLENIVNCCDKLRRDDSID